MRKDAAEPSGSMSIAAPAVFGRRHISPGVAEFAASNPKLSIDLRLMERQVDPGTAGADVCFRIGGLADSDYIATKVGRTRRALCASPGFAGGALAKPIRFALVANGLLCLAGGVGYLTENTALVFVTMNPGMGGAILVATVALAVYFRRLAAAGSIRTG